MRARSLLFSLFFAGLSLAPPPRAFATTVMAVSMQELVAVSGLVVRGRVVSVESVWVGGHPERSVLLEVSEQFKGNPVEGPVAFWSEGGRVGRWASVVAGAPQFEPGQEVIVLLEQRSDGAWTPAGLSLGVFFVEAGDGGQAQARRSFDGLVFAEPSVANGSSAQSLNPVWSLNALSAFLRSQP